MNSNEDFAHRYTWDWLLRMTFISEEIYSTFVRLSFFICKNGDNKSYFECYENEMTYIKHLL